MKTIKLAAYILFYIMLLKVRPVIAASLVVIAGLERVANEEIN